MPDQVVIVGGGVAALRCALDLRERGFDGRLSMLSAEGTPPYDRTLVSKALISGDPVDADRLLLQSLEAYDGAAIELRLGVRATALEAADRRVVLEDGTRVAYDRLVLAVGGEPVRPPELMADGVVTLRELGDAQRLEPVLAGVERVVIIGAEAARLVTTLRYFAADAWFPHGEVYGQSLTAGQVYTLPRPLGLVGLITPWNFPLAIPAWKLAPALISGNTVVLKPSEEAPVSALHLARCLVDAGLPPGVLNVVIGRGAEAGAELVARPEVHAISFTGSAEVGRRVRDDATVLGKRVQLELGGQNPLVVMADADLPRAVEAAYAGAFFAAGQKCTATRRIFVQQDVYDEFRERLLERMNRAVIGDPTDPRTELGPLINRRQYDAVLQAIEQGRRQGGELLNGGEHRDDDGYFVSPTLFENVDDTAELARREVSGPVASLFSFATLDEALARTNDVEYGLSAAIFTSALATAQRYVGAVQAGVIHVNSTTTGAEVYVPFGGIKASAWGPHEQGRAAIEFYTDVATIYLDA